MRQYLLQALPVELIEAARVDGRTSLRTCGHVLPIARPAMAVLGMLVFVTAWNDFFWPFIALNQQNPTVQVALNGLGSGYVPDNAVIMAGALRRDAAAAAGVRRARQADRRRDHRRRGEELTPRPTRSAVPRPPAHPRRSPHAPSPFPPRLRLGGGDRRLPDRGRRAEDGRTPSIWDTFSHTPGRVATATPVTSPPTTTTASATTSR